MRLAFDISSIVWSCLLGGTDIEGKKVEFEGKSVQVNTAAYGYEKVINLMVAALQEVGCSPMDCILVPEGMNSKAPRLMIDKLYKVGRGRPQECYVEFQKLRDNLIDVWRSMGAIAVSQDNVEADDVLAWLAENMREDLMIVTNDGDMTVLNGRNKYGAVISVRIDGVVGQNKYGMFPCKYITLYKSLVGDTSDKIKGIKGFGDAAWRELDMRFGEKGMDYLVSLLENHNLIALEEEAEKDKFVKKLFEGREDWQRSYRLARLYPEWVNTMQNPLQWKPGFVHKRQSDLRLAKWSASRRLVTADNWDAFVPWAQQQLRHRPWYALDIETSTPPESDDWLLAQGDGNGVDVIGSKLTGLSLTFGANMQMTVYISVDHKDTKNVSKEKVGEFLASIKQIPVIHNTFFEGPVLFNEFGEAWKDNGWEGFLPNWRDTKLEASYVDENDKLGLKRLSKKWLDYDQVEYGTVTTLEFEPEELGEGEVSSRGGKFLGIFNKELTPEVQVLQTDENGEQHIVVVEKATYKPVERRSYKMNELSAEHVFDYACDDTATTSGLHNFFMLFMSLEGTWDVYEKVELDASYLHAQSFVHGVNISMPKLQELVKEDDASFDEAKQTVDSFLVKNGWNGTTVPVFTEIDATAIKTAYEVVVGEPLKTMVQTPEKLIAMFADTHPTLAGACSDLKSLNEIVAHYFKAAPVFNTGSPKQLQNLFYEVMKLPMRVWNKPTEAMKARGEKVGTPKTDNLAIAYALRECSEEHAEVLKALRIMKMVETRRGLYYDPYPYFVHWKTGRVHSSHNQCATNTRRASSAKPNLQQLSKNVKVEGFSPRVREIIVPHKKDAVIVSMDFMAQELRVIADCSKDPNMLSCFLGDSPKDMHALTGLGIYNSRHGTCLSYEEFHSLVSVDKEAKQARTLGKLTNFTTEYGAAAPKLAQTLLVSEEDAQAFIDAKELAFPVASEWKKTVIQGAKSVGFVTTRLGARRHLTTMLMSSDKFEASKAERQSVNFIIQSSSAEMTKLAEGRVFRNRILVKYDCEYVAAIHDELCFSVAESELAKFIPEVHAIMTEQYADMVVPVGSSVSFGPSFGVQVELEGDFSEEKISAVLSEFRALGTAYA